MKKINKILFPTDFSPAASNAFRYALQLADVLDASVQVVHAVFPEYEAADLPVMTGQFTQAKMEAAAEAGKNFVEAGFIQLQNSFSFENVPEVDAEIEIGTPVNVICNVAERENIDLIFMGTQGENHTLDKLLGTVASEVVEKAPCAVMVIPENAVFKGLDNIVFATDLEKADPYFIWEATRFLEPFDAILRCVHIDKEGKPNKDHMIMEDLEAFFEEHSPNRQIKFYDLPGKSITDKLNEFVEVFDVDLVVMHSPRRSFFGRLFHKSQTAAMARMSKVPLLVLR